MDVNFTLDEISEAAGKFIRLVPGTGVIAFEGEMGAGKTTFIHAVCDQLGIKDTVSSPTFSIINEYVTESGNKIFRLDLYRIRDNDEAVNAGVEDCYYSGNLCLVEWPLKAPGILPADTVHCRLLIKADNTRNLQINL